MRYTAQAQQLLLEAAEHARNFGHSYVGSTHLLLALSQESGLAGQMLRIAGGTESLLHKMMAVLYGVGTARLPLPQGFSQDASAVLRDARTG